ncbi:hypothetical protein GCM10025867_50420 (plasmid) [Frondihabitans sucicola]|uniref:Uncharacterized protein n=1 Tax=Frondihabitans sucicola TaxID=1268041 RepID=A0ABM8GWF3_9MICO|nr:hypothetical protein [Frondihabitans sucicola]BDZ52801.1 hypothetical protein GCM10025867_50420 [Frondihabitans sucicola]
MATTPTPEIVSTPGRWALDFGYRLSKSSRIAWTVVLAWDVAALIRSIRGGADVSTLVLGITCVFGAAMFLNSMSRKRVTRRHFRRDADAQQAADAAVAAYASAAERAAAIRERGLIAEQDTAAVLLGRSMLVALDMHHPPRWLGPELKRLLPDETVPMLSNVTAKLDAMFPAELANRPL